MKLCCTLLKNHESENVEKPCRGRMKGNGITFYLKLCHATRLKIKKKLCSGFLQFLLSIFREITDLTGDTILPLLLVFAPAFDVRMSLIWKDMHHFDDCDSHIYIFISAGVRRLEQGFSRWKNIQHFCLSLFLPSSSLSGKTFWRRPKLWWRTQRCWCPVLLPVRTDWLRLPTLLPKPLPSSQMWSNLELPVLALTTLRHRWAGLFCLSFIHCACYQRYGRMSCEWQ